MSNEEARACHTQHAFLVVWGRFAHEMGLIKRIEAVKLKQKRYWHSPQTKVLEFLVATLAGLQHLEVLNLFDTQVDNTGLQYLEPMQRLKTVYLWQTHVTPEGADVLQQHMPGLTVNTGINVAAQ